MLRTLSIDSLREPDLSELPNSVIFLANANYSYYSHHKGDRYDDRK
jgi:hypothetical protein